MISVLKKRVVKRQCEVFKVFDGEFSSSKEALVFATYKINKAG